MARFLVKVVTGPENTTRAALGLLVARTAIEDGHEVTLFLAGDAVDFIRAETAEAAHGLGTGAVAEHLRAIREAGAAIHLSAMSGKARAIDESVAGEGVQFSRPQDVVRLAAEADTVLIY